MHPAFTSSCLCFFRSPPGGWVCGRVGGWFVCQEGWLARYQAILMLAGAMV